jgi:hypothetical protein
VLVVPTRPDRPAIFLTLPYVHDIVEEIWRQFELAQPRILAARVGCREPWPAHAGPPDPAATHGQFCVVGNRLRNRVLAGRRFRTRYEANCRAAIEIAIDADPVSEQ